MTGDAHPPFVLLRGFVHSLLVTAVLAAAVLYLVVTRYKVDLETAASIATHTILLVFAFSWLLSWGIQTQRALATLLGLALAIGAACLPLIALGRYKPPLPADLDFKEHGDFVRLSGLLCHPALGATFDDPGPAFVRDAETTLQQRRQLQERVGPGPLEVWAWSSPATGERFEVELVRGPGETAQGFREFTDGFQRGLTRSGVTIESQVASGERSPLRFELQGAGARGAKVDVVCIDSPTPGKQSAALCLSTLASDHERLQRLRASLRAAPCPPSAPPP